MRKKWMLWGCAVILVLGCATDTKPTNAKLEKALNTYFEGHNECLFPTMMRFPYEVSPGSDAKAEAKRLDAMTGAELLAKQSGAAIKVERYTLTPLGQRVGGRFCYGHRQVTSVDAFTPPVKQGGFLQTTVNYHSTMVDVPVWVKTDDMKAAFPEMADGNLGPATRANHDGECRGGMAGAAVGQGSERGDRRWQVQKSGPGHPADGISGCRKSASKLDHSGAIAALAGTGLG